MVKISNKKKGDIFEKYISSLYEALNFSIVHNKTISGQQVDIYAEKLISGIGKIKLIIECKYLENGAVSNQNVYDFNAYISSIVNIDKAVKGILVTNRDFSKDSKKAAEDLNVTLLTQETLENEIFNLKEPFIKIKSLLEKQEIFKEFIPLFGSFEGINKQSLQNINLIDKIYNLQFVDWSKITFISILADYGSGKTTLLKRLNYLFAKKHLEGGKKKPIYLELKNFELYKDLKSFLINSFIKLFQREIPIETIFERINMGEFIFLLDGFDEMSPQVDRTKRIENLLKLSPLLLSNSNSILTCRPSYFISTKEFDSAINTIVESNLPPLLEQGKPSSLQHVRRNKRSSILYEKLISKYTDSINIKKESSKIGSDAVTINIYPFNDDQVGKYLEKFDAGFKTKCNSTWIEVKVFLESIYDISDLLKKPILLSMIKDTIFELGEDYRIRNEVFDPSSLYETYTKANLHRDYTKGTTRQLLSNIERDKFAEAIAYLMFERDVLSISYKTLLKLVEEKSDIVSGILFIQSVTIEQIASDIQICSFIQRTENDEFKFIHKSYMEFYVARQLKRAFSKNRKSLLETKHIQKEILFFLGCYKYSDPKLNHKILKIIGSNANRKPILKRNLLVAYLHSNKNHNKLIANKTNVQYFSLKDTILDDCKLWEISFHESEITNITLKNGTELRCSIKQTSINSIRTINSFLSFSKDEKELQGEYDYMNLKSIGSEINITSKSISYFTYCFFHSTTLMLNCQTANLRNCSLKKSRLYLLKCDIDLIDCHIYDSVIQPIKSKTDKENIHFIRFSNSTIRDMTLSLENSNYSVVMANCKFINVHFDNLIIYPFPDKIIENSRFINCTGSIIAANFVKDSHFSFLDMQGNKVKFVYNKTEKIKIGDLEISVLKK